MLINGLAPIANSLFIIPIIGFGNEIQHFGMPDLENFLSNCFF
jgi:hypothetical protein